MSADRRLSLGAQWDVFDRPMKPVALGLLMLDVVLCVFNATGGDTLGDSVWSVILSPIAGAAALLFLIAWWMRLQSLLEVALLATFGIHIARAAFIALVVGDDTLGVPDFWQGLAVAVIAGGSFLLERRDEVTP